MKISLSSLFSLLTLLGLALAGTIQFQSIYQDFTNSNLMRNLAFTFKVENGLSMNMMMRVVSPIQLHSDDLLTNPQVVIKKREGICQEKSIQEFLSFDFLSFGWQDTNIIQSTDDLITATVLQSTLTEDTGKFAYFMWFSQDLSPNTMYTMVVSSAKQYVVADPGMVEI